MAARPGWSGFLKFNLISVPVQGYNAQVSGGGKIGFHLLHAKCHQRIRYQKVCPIHGEVSNDEIVPGYEVAKGKYVEVPREERDEARSEDDKTIAVESFLRPELIPPFYFSGRTYYLVPDGKVAHKPYAVMLEAMRRQNRFALARVVFSGRPQLAVVYPCEGVLALSLLSYASELRKPSAYSGDIGSEHGSAEERRLAATLIEAATTDSFDPDKYKDEYNDRLASLVESKAKRSTRPTRSNQAQPEVIHLIDALRKSLNKANASLPRGKKAAATEQKKTAAHPRRKTG